MPSARILINKARRDLHEILQVPAFYVDPAGLAQRVTVRFADRMTEPGELSGTAYAHKYDIVPEVKFMREQLNDPVRNALIIVADDEVYRIDTVMPSHGITVSAQVIRLRKEELAALDFPIPGQF